MSGPSERRTILDCIGKTPLVHLREASRQAGVEILGKCEFMNPGLSLKDRTALYIVEEAERSGALRPGGTIVEGTAGNTGIGLAMIAAAKGYQCILVIPNTMAREKVDIVRSFGAEVRLVEKKPWGDPQHYNTITEALSKEIPGAIWANQFHNAANIRAHYATTGPEIWEQTRGEVDLFLAGMGTSGTMGGAGRYLREVSEKAAAPGGPRAGRGRTKIVAVDPHGSVYYSVFTTGEPKAEGSSIVEGVGIGRIPGNYDGSVLDDIIRISDTDAVRMAHTLVRKEGLFVGGCSYAGRRHVRGLPRSLAPPRRRDPERTGRNTSRSLQPGVARLPEPARPRITLPVRRNEPRRATLSPHDRSLRRGIHDPTVSLAPTTPCLTEAVAENDGPLGYPGTAPGRRR
jgi:cysteine synthase A